MTELRRIFESLAAGLQKPVFNTAARLTGNPEDALDITREVFARAYALFLSGEYRAPSLVGLYRILIDVSARRVYDSTLDAPSWLDSCAPTDPPDLPVTMGESPAVHEAFQELASDLKAAYLLRDVESLSYSQIAFIVRTGKPTVARRVYSARRRLRMAVRDHLQRRLHMKPTRDG